MSYLFPGLFTTLRCASGALASEGAVPGGRLPLRRAGRGFGGHRVPPDRYLIRAAHHRCPGYQARMMLGFSWIFINGRHMKYAWLAISSD